jgi:hypothetical protein
MTNNWMELRLSDDEDERVRKGAELHKITNLQSLDTVLEIAACINILKARYKNSGIRGAFGDALVQYGYINRDGFALNKALISHYTTLLDNEKDVRAWWETVKKSRPARRWVGVSAIHNHWTRHLRAEAEEKRRLDAEARGVPLPPKKPSPMVELKKTNWELQEQLHAANERAKKADGGNLFDLELDSADHIGRVIVDNLRGSPGKIENLIRTLSVELKKLRALTKTARPKKSRKAKVQAGLEKAAAPINEMLRNLLK